MMADDNLYKNEFKNLIKKSIDDGTSTLDYYKNLEYIEMTPEYITKSLKVVKQKSAKKRLSRATSIAAASLLILVASSAIAVVITTNTVDAVKNKIERQMIKVRNVLVIKEDNPVQIDDAGKIILEIKDWNDVEDGRKFLKELYIPKYIPEGYQFEILTLEKQLDDRYKATYIFTVEDAKNIYINQYYIKEPKETNFIVSNEGNTLETSHGTVYVTLDEFSDMISGILINDSNRVSIAGEIPSEELKKIFEGLEQ